MPTTHLKQANYTSELPPKADSISATGTESDYESDGGSHYSPKDFLGAGRYARARRFESPKGKPVVVLAPNCYGQVPLSEVDRKYRFFSQHYPGEKSYLFCSPEDEKNLVQSFRMVVPLIPGVTYKNYIRSVGKISKIEQQIHQVVFL